MSEKIEKKIDILETKMDNLESKIDNLVVVMNNGFIRADKRIDSLELGLVTKIDTDIEGLARMMKHSFDHIYEEMVTKDDLAEIYERLDTIEALI